MLIDSVLHCFLFALFVVDWRFWIRLFSLIFAYFRLFLGKCWASIVETYIFAARTTTTHYAKRKD